MKEDGVVGDGTTDDTAAIRAVLDAANAFTTAGVTVYFPAGTYRVAAGLHPSQPATHANRAANVTVFTVGDNVSCSGTAASAPSSPPSSATSPAPATPARDTSSTSATTSTPKASTSPGTTAPERGPSSRPSTTTAMIGSLRLATRGQLIRDREFSHIPGFYVGTHICDTARLLDNVVRDCANGYNMNSRGIFVSGNTRHPRASKPAATATGPPATTSAASTVDASTSSTTRSTSATSQIPRRQHRDRRRSRLLRLRRREQHRAQRRHRHCRGPRTFAVVSNAFREKQKYAVSVAGGATTTTSRDGIISGNTIDLTYDGATVASACLNYAFQDGYVAVTGNSSRQALPTRSSRWRPRPPPRCTSPATSPAAATP